MWVNVFEYENSSIRIEKGELIKSDIYRVSLCEIDEQIRIRISCWQWNNIMDKVLQSNFSAAHISLAGVFHFVISPLLLRNDSGTVLSSLKTERQNCATTDIVRHIRPMQKKLSVQRSSKNHHEHLLAGNISSNNRIEHNEREEKILTKKEQQINSKQNSIRFNSAFFNRISLCTTTAERIWSFSHSNGTK